MVNQERIVNKFCQYVQIASPTKSEGEFARFITKELEALGMKVIIDGAGEIVGSDTGNVIARLEGTTSGETILLSCHMDTVSPGVNIKPVIRDGVIYSDGTTVLGGDNKAGIAAIVEAITLLKENNIPHAGIEVALSIYEEGGLHGAKNMDFSKFEAKRAFVLDSGGEPGQIIIQGPAQDKIDVKIIGKPAHAGVAPEEGISAIMVAAKAIENMKLLRIDEDTTANIGVVQGGSVTNIVMPELTIQAEARSLNNDKLNMQSKHMVECFVDAAESFGAQVDIELKRMYGAFVIDENAPIVEIVKKACANLSLKAFTASSGGGSDTNIFNTNGITAVNLGIGERKPHTLEEHLHIKDLVNTAAMLVEIIKLHCNV